MVDEVQNNTQFTYAKQKELCEYKESEYKKAKAITAKLETAKEKLQNEIYAEYNRRTINMNKRELDKKSHSIKNEVFEEFGFYNTQNAYTKASGIEDCLLSSWRDSAFSLHKWTNY